MRKYIKQKDSKNIEFKIEDFLKKHSLKKNVIINSTKVVTILAVIITGFICITNLKEERIEISLDDSNIALSIAPLAATSAKTDIISIPSGIVKANPFLPYREIGSGIGNNVPNYELIEPPEAIASDSEAARVMDTTVSGILYDKFSPSAILNIEGNDYLVKKGDTVNNYKVVQIAQDSVTVTLGKNTYKAGIGEILTEGTLNYSNIPNIDKKFGGDKK